MQTSAIGKSLRKVNSGAEKKSNKLDSFTSGAGTQFTQNFQERLPLYLNLKQEVGHAGRPVCGLTENLIS